MVGRRSFRFGARLFSGANLLLVLGSVISAASLLVEFSQSIHQFGTKFLRFKEPKRLHPLARTASTVTKGIMYSC